MKTYLTFINHNEKFVWVGLERHFDQMPPSTKDYSYVKYIGDDELEARRMFTKLSKGYIDYKQNYDL
jgi:hypothetical protein